MQKEFEEIRSLDQKIASVMSSIDLNSDASFADDKEQFDRIKTVKNCIHERTLKVFTHNLKKLIQLETTQKRLSRKIGISEDLLSKYKNGTSFPTVETLVYICKIYDIRLDKLLNSPFDAGDIEHIENRISIMSDRDDISKFFEPEYFTYFFVTNPEREGAIHEGVLEIVDMHHGNFKILSHNRNTKKEIVIKQFEGTYSSTSKLVFFSMTSKNDGNAYITMIKPSLNISSFEGGIAMLTLPSDANSKPCSQKILLSRNRIDREINYKALFDILSFSADKAKTSFGNVKISYEDNEKAYKFIKNRL